MRNICITHTTDRVIDHDVLFKLNDHLTFLVVGEEYGDIANKRHYQIYAEFNKQMYNKGLRTLFGVVEGEVFHHENRRGTATQAAEYCMKDGNYNVYGEPKKKDQSAMRTLFNSVKEGKTNIELLEENPDVALDRNSIKFMRESIEEDNNEKRKRLMIEKWGPVELYPHQEFIKSEFLNQDDREILWVYDQVGNTGKSVLAMHLLAVLESVIYLQNGKSSDLAHIYNGQEHVVFDLTRSTESRINYTIIEQMKNGLVYSPKYQSKMKYSMGVKILILANHLPNFEAMSKDRWNVIKLDNKKSKEGLAGVTFRSYDLAPSENSASDDDECIIRMIDGSYSYDESSD